eukprot:TRINITY_DN76800_c0_g1_i1.p1 TRINITY_DN76800_c0_g1~~TRINITY_DN76800_c0_g1_i1.p1  ORF type:complete len:291 (-),score=61.65 TRINITY_DN76800_c0_g1_i1:515-1387(-)
MFCLTGRSGLERFRVICTVCLVFDALFVLIFSLSGLTASAYTAKTACYEQHGYTWHNVLALSLLMSAMLALWGVSLHGSITISGPGAPLQMNQLQRASRYGHVLLGWTFLAAVVDAIAYRQQPPVCAGEDQETVIQPAMSDSNEHSGLTDLHVDAIWQMAYTVMWLIWIVGVVSAAMSAKRNMPLLEEAMKEAGEIRNNSFAEEANGTPTLVGRPVRQQDLPEGAVVAGAFAPSRDADGAAGGSPEDGGQAPTFQGQPLGPGPIGPNGVAQGMPVREEESGKTGGPKVVS